MKKYKVIYADPPWAYKVWSKKGAGRSAESHYPTMDIEAIKALPVGELADKDCALFLWITFPMLREAWGVMDAWGFTFKTVAFVWIKQCRKSDGLFTGMGYWTRANAEICLLATRGRPKRAARDVKQVILSHVERRIDGYQFSYEAKDAEVEGLYLSYTISGVPVFLSQPAGHNCAAQE